MMSKIVKEKTIPYNLEQSKIIDTLETYQGAKARVLCV